jgi:hypothetical protein
VIQLALLLAAQAADPLPLQNDIVVIGEKLKRWAANVREVDGKWKCTTKRSTGDAEIDKIGCDSMIHCYPPMKDRLVRLQNRSIAKSVRKAEAKLVSDDMTKCVFEKRADLIAELAERRRAR